MSSTGDVHEGVEGPLPNFLIIGAQKSGTTTLRAALDAHPEAFCAREIHFFNQRYDRGLDWYRERFTAADGLPAIGEKCPNYLSHPAALDRLANDLPGVKLIAILRHPVDRAYSNYWHERRGRRETLSFAEAIDAEPERVRHSGVDGPFAYIARGRYLPQLQRVSRLVPRDRLLVLLFEDLRNDPKGTFGEVCRFLGIDGTVAPPELHMRANPYRTHRPEWLWRFMMRKRLWRRLPRRMAKWLRARMEQEIPYEPMDPAVRRRLLDSFADDNAALATWLGRDLSGWSK